MRTREDLLFVGSQLLLFAGLAYDPWGPQFDYPTWLRVVGWLAMAVAPVVGVLALLQLGGSFTPWPSPRAGGDLVTTGVYQWARHPIYACLIYFAMGLTIVTDSPWRGMMTGLLWLLFYYKSRYEERLLRERFPDYGAYAQEVRRFGGGLTPWSGK